MRRPRGLAARRRHRLRRLRQPQEGRLQALPAQEHRPRPDLDVDRRRPARAAAPSTRSPRTTSTRTCCSPAPSSASSSRSTAARSGSSSRAGCRRSRSATSRSSSARTTSCSPPSAAASTSSTTTRRCGASSREALEKEAVALPGARTRSPTCERYPLGGSGKGSTARRFFTAENPPFGAVFTYYLKDELKTPQGGAPGGGEARPRRRARTSSTRRWDELRAEDRDEDPAIVLTVTDARGQRRAPAHRPGRRRASTASPGTCAGPRPMPARSSRQPTTTPTYDAADRADGAARQLPRAARAAGRRRGDAARRAADLRRQAAGQHHAPGGRPRGAGRLPARRPRSCSGRRSAPRAPPTSCRSGSTRSTTAIMDTPRADLALRQQAVGAAAPARGPRRSSSTATRRSRRRNEPVPPAIVDRVQQVVGGSWGSTGEPTATHRRNYEIASGELGGAAARSCGRRRPTSRRWRSKAEELGAPWTPGRIPTWERASERPAPRGYRRRRLGTSHALRALG